MDRTAVFVDAGYLFAAGSQLLTSQTLPRGEMHLDHDTVLKSLGDLAHQLTGLPLLRVYWYDGTTSGPTPQQLALAYRPSLKLRLGFVNAHGQQEGVDSLIITDLIQLARNRAMADAVLLTGDEDILVGVQQAQELGVRVHLLGIEPSIENQSRSLVQEADSVRELSFAEVSSFLKKATELLPAFESTDLDRLAQQAASELSSEDIRAVLEGSAGVAIPAEIDRRLLLSATQALGGAQLASGQKRSLRSAFIDACRKK
jgi:hypothetical protein